MSNVNISTHSIFLPTFWLKWIDGRIFTVKNVAQDPDVDNAISFANNKRSSTVPITCCCRGQRIEIVKTEPFWCPVICIIVIRVQQITSHHLCIFTLKRQTLFNTYLHRGLFEWTGDRLFPNSSVIGSSAKTRYLCSLQEVIGILALKGKLSHFFIPTFGQK